LYVGLKRMESVYDGVIFDYIYTYVKQINFNIYELDYFLGIGL